LTHWADILTYEQEDTSVLMRLISNAGTGAYTRVVSSLNLNIQLTQWADILTYEQEDTNVLVQLISSAEQNKTL